MTKHVEILALLLVAVAALVTALVIHQSVMTELGHRAAELIR